MIEQQGWTAKPPHCVVMKILQQLKVKNIFARQKARLCTAGAQTFDMLREVDEVGGIDTAYSRLPSCDGVGMALYNRLIRAAGYEVIDLEKI